ncbi:MAG: hypothetical protein M1834_000465 [Cirrosporium novae-zelandiae]|nr:MAG: hypothetical protein M1834_000465 [Cirrosporium novae-zelandiae]
MSQPSSQVSEDLPASDAEGTEGNTHTNLQQDPFDFVIELVGRIILQITEKLNQIKNNINQRFTAIETANSRNSRDSRSISPEHQSAELLNHKIKENPVFHQLNLTGFPTLERTVRQKSAPLTRENAVPDFIKTAAAAKQPILEQQKSAATLGIIPQKSLEQSRIQFVDTPETDIFYKPFYQAEHLHSPLRAQYQ